MIKGQPGLEAYRNTDRVLRERLDIYSANLVRIVNKGGQLVPFHWNEVQAELHQTIERQLSARGLVRVIVLKARQLGISTYTAVRFYHRTSLWPGRRTFILTHEDSATQTLFGMAKRIHDNMPIDYQPQATAANANEMQFGKMRSGYRVGTAKNVSGLGRSQTLQNLHGSEVAFWPHAEAHFSGVVQAVPLSNNTEIILESTANGIGGTFYEQWSLAERGLSDFVPVFLPWFKASEYGRTPHREWTPSQQEGDYGNLYRLNEGQLFWLHTKNIELGSQPGEICSLFRQEYPATAAEAFQSTGAESFIPSEMVIRARRLILERQPHAPRVLGVDLARGGSDRTCFIDRQGRKAGGLINEAHSDADLVVVADKIAAILYRNPDIRRAYIDATEMGGGSVYDMLRAMGYGDRVAAVNFGAGATDPDHFVNKRAEMYGRMKQWFSDAVGVDIPDEDALHRELSAPGYRHDAHSRLLIEPKEKIKKRLKFSPDKADALALTFAEIIAPDPVDSTPKWAREHTRPRRRDFMTA